MKILLKHANIYGSQTADILVEDGVITGGVAEYLSGVLRQAGITNTAVKAFPDAFFMHGSRAQVCEDAGMAPKDLQAAARTLLKV